MANRKPSIASTCRLMILNGKTDDQIWKKLKKMFNIDDKRRYYIKWYRAEVVRKGLDKEVPADRRVAAHKVDQERRHSKHTYH